MEILGNVQLLSSCNRVLTSLRYQDGYCGYGGSWRYHYGMFAVHKLPFVAPKFRLRSKKWKKEQKMKNRGSIRIGKIVWGRCARQKIFLNFGNQLRCAISEISSYSVYERHRCHCMLGVRQSTFGIRHSTFRAPVSICITSRLAAPRHSARVTARHSYIAAQVYI